MIWIYLKKYTKHNLYLKIFCLVFFFFIKLNNTFPIFITDSEHTTHTHTHTNKTKWLISLLSLITKRLIIIFDIFRNSFFSTLFSSLSFFGEKNKTKKTNANETRLKRLVGVGGGSRRSQKWCISRQHIMHIEI